MDILKWVGPQRVLYSLFIYSFIFSVCVCVCVCEFKQDFFIVTNIFWTCDEIEVSIEVLLFDYPNETNEENQTKGIHWNKWHSKDSWHTVGDGKKHSDYLLYNSLPT